MNNQPPSTSKDDNLLNPNTFYLNKQPYSSNSLKSTFSDTNREPLNYDILQDRYATHEKIKRPGKLIFICLILLNLIKLTKLKLLSLFNRYCR